MGQHASSSKKAHAAPRLAERDAEWLCAVVAAHRLVCAADVLPAGELADAVRRIGATLPPGIETQCAALLAAGGPLDSVAVEPSAVLAAWLPMYRSCAGVASDATAVAFHPAHCRVPTTTTMPASLLDWLLHVGDPAATVPRASQVLALYLTRPYLLTTPTPAAPLRADRAAGLVIPHLDLLATARQAPSRLLLAPPTTLMLAAHLPPDMRDTWRLAYSSARDGAAWASLVRGLFTAATSSLRAAATLLLVRDTHGHVFGGYVAASPLRLRAAFQGASDLWPHTASDFPSDRGPPALVFSAHPTMRVYLPTGRNDNLVYANAGMSTLPHGVGLGGQMDHWGLWLDGGMQRGHSRVISGAGISSTYGNPVLASAEDFDVDAIEAWTIESAQWQRDPDRDDVLMDAAGGGGGKKSVLEQYPELVDLIEMSGRKMYSKEVAAAEPLIFDDDDHDN